ncbi:hypothetical protein TVAG_000580 [Trichomonas vaginalis G3]|uniref:TPR Domain containing protein n=1 Tax=Trichomonas vaginalis (strain ATCC PRA-98 / G3) TaxID=412133 RepID=A2EHT4_TRIV3|nr:tetratricopeptide repeat domain domain-containing protein [Trichomonas vaginalis G3]EAY07774.1 hypothetical protein TVAG_000580 [Trichomonas vaginalis G3]KAI5542951.1 tetratricopeptide repeat domain domain-containing protein [Trichomonas vaginalis G3]|eukprot:XP_001319997.1 hypothetical protein [Trichomonas vaginalis G3]
MLNNFSCPFQQYSQITIPNKYPVNKPITIEPSAEINQEFLEDLEKQSTKYFSHHLNANKYRTRIPEERTTSFDSVVNTRYKDVRTAVNQSLFFTRAQPIAQQSLRLSAICLQNRKYDEVITIIERLIALQNYVSLGPVYSFLASILKGSFEDESHAFYQLEYVSISQKDLPHFFHLLDEMITLNVNDKPCLLSFMYHDIPTFISIYHREPHVMPLISSKITSLKNNPIRNGLEIRGNNLRFLTTENLIAKASAAADALPSLRPAIETPRATVTNISPKDTSQVALFITEGKYSKAVALASLHLQAGTKFAEMYMYRAIALYYLDNIPGAIVDMSRSIDLEPTDEKYKARAAFWLALGDRDLCAQDLQRVTNREGLSK